MEMKLSLARVQTAWNIQRWRWRPSQCSRRGWTSTAWWNLWTTAKAHELVVRLSNNPKIDWQSTACSLENKLSDSSQLIGKEDDLHEVCPTQSHEWDRRGFTACKDFTHINHIKSHFLNCTMTGVSIQPWNNMSDHRLKNKVTETQRVLCAKVEDKNDVASFDRQGVID
jgi:hypothetical protein